MQDTPFKFSIHLISSLSRRINWDIKVVSFVIFSSLHSVSVLLVHLYAHIKRQVKVLILEFYNSSICCFSYWKKEKEKKKQHHRLNWKVLLSKACRKGAPQQSFSSQTIRENEERDQDMGAATKDRYISISASFSVHFAVNDCTDPRCGLSHKRRLSIFINS